MLVLLAFAAVGVWAMPEPGHPDGKPRLRPQALRVTAQARPAFVRGGVAAFAGFAVLGLFAALSPALIAAELPSPTPALVGVVVAAVFLASTLGELFLGRVSGPAGLLFGCVALIAGMGFLAVSLATSSFALLVIGGLIAGFGQVSASEPGSPASSERPPPTSEPRSARPSSSSPTSRFPCR